jgi:hypothetical protein
MQAATPQQAVVSAARQRAQALADGDAELLTSLLHPEFQWTSHLGESFDREEYVRRNTQGHTVWRLQELHDVHVVVVAETAVLRAEVSDVVLTAVGEPATFAMPMTQVWVREGSAWRCLAGHAGPRRT